jgi:hypothetical protein
LSSGFEGRGDEGFSKAIKETFEVFSGNLDFGIDPDRPRMFRLIYYWFKNQSLFTKFWIETGIALRPR